MYARRKKNIIAVAHPYHEGKSCSKSGLIPPSGLGGDSVTDRRMDAGRAENIMLLSQTLTMRGSLASLVKFLPVV